MIVPRVGASNNLIHWMRGLANLKLTSRDRLHGDSKPGTLGQVLVLGKAGCERDWRSTTKYPIPKETSIFTRIQRF